jgi:PAS domain S-box-containing protein
MPRRRPPPRDPPVSLTRLRFFERLFHDTAIGAMVFDLQGRVTHVNPAAARLLGWDAKELIGRPVSDLAAPGTQPMLQWVLDSGQSWSGILPRRRKSGSVFQARAVISIVRDEIDEPLALISFFVDDTPNQRRRARLASLAALGAALNAEPDPDALLVRICQEARDLFRAEGVYLARLDDTTRELVGLIGSGPLADQVSGHRVPLAGPADALGRAIAERCAIIQHHVRPKGEHAELIAALRVRSTLLAPLLSGERVLGLLALTDTRHDDRFGPEDAELAQAFAEIAAVAIESARLHQAARTRSERLLTLARVNQLLTASLEREEVLQAITDGARRLLGVDDVSVWLLQEPAEPFHLAHYVTKSGQVPSRALDRHTSKLAKILASSRPWQTADLVVEGSQPDALHRFEGVRARGGRGCLMVPLAAHDRPLGGIMFVSHAVRTFDREEVELAQAFARQAALALQNAETLATERQASRLRLLLQRSKSLDPHDRLLVEQLLAAAERVIELADAGEKVEGRR